MEDKNKDKIEIIGKNGQKIEITEAEQERRAKIKKVNDEFKVRKNVEFFGTTL